MITDASHPTWVEAFIVVANLWQVVALAWIARCARPSSGEPPIAGRPEDDASSR